MKTYEETMEAIFSKGDAIFAEKNSRVRSIKRTSAAVSGVCAAAIVGFTVFRNDDLKNAAPNHNKNEKIITENQSTTTTTASQTTITVTEKTATTAKSTKKTTSSTSATSATASTPTVTETEAETVKETALTTESTSVQTETAETSAVLNITENTTSQTTALPQSTNTSSNTAMTETSSATTFITETINTGVTYSMTTNATTDTALTTVTTTTASKFRPEFQIVYEDTYKVFFESFELKFVRQRFIISDDGEKVYVGEHEILETWDNADSMPHMTEYYDRDGSYDYMLIADKLPENCTYQGGDSLRFIVQQFSYYNVIKIQKQTDETVIETGENDFAQQ
ncbi:MAG: hypothetical protein IJ779_02800 [Ruminococcus sp.]|nr:hypothetical protein [Ruminococcus sp.]